MLDDSSTAQSAVTGRVLVVDDEPDNRELLRTLLEMKGHTVFDAGNGAEALDMVKDALPDVILLDVMMPEMDGYEVCRRLKGDPETAPVPIIMVTALAGRSDRLEGIDAGANDFLTKPVGAQDVILRVRNSIYTKRLYDQVNESLDRLRELEELRDNLTHMIVHDMRSPLMGICGSLELLQMTVADRLDEEDRDDMERALDSSRLLTEMVSSLLDVSRLEAGKM
ncbi:MAG: response regulator, partial [Lentisphaerae bacterium]|nr:response regulator [Lentisphaerota bacterium]